MAGFRVGAVGSLLRIENFRVNPYTPPMAKRRAPDYCPACGTEVPPHARACPSCGSDEQTGWSEHAQEDRLGIPSEEFDYDEFVKEEFSVQQEDRTRPRGIGRFWWVVAMVLLLFLFYQWWPR